MQRIFALLKGNTRCVVLNACYTEPLAKAIADNMNCVVVGVTGEISDTCAIGFAGEFYKQLADGENVSKAFQLASTHVPQDNVRSNGLNINASQLVFVKKWPSQYAFLAISAVILIIASYMIWSLINVQRSPNGNTQSTPKVPNIVMEPPATFTNTPTTIVALSYTSTFSTSPIINSATNEVSNKATHRVVIPIGVAISLSGRATAIGEEQQQGIYIAKTYFEKKYEGYEIQIILENGGAELNKTDNEMATLAFTKLVSTDVIAIIGPTLSAQALVVDYIAQDRNIPVVAISNTHPKMRAIMGNYIFRVSAGVEKFAPKVISKVAAHEEVNNAVLLYLDEPDSFTIPECEDGFRPFLAPNQITPVGKLISYTNIVENNEAARDAIIESVFSTAPFPDLIIICGLTNDGAALIKGLKKAGYKGVIVGGNGLSTPSLLSKCKGECEGVYLAQAYDYMSYSPLNEAFKEFYGQDSPTQFAAQAFTGVQVIVEAISNINMTQSFATMSVTEKRLALREYFLNSHHRYETLLYTIEFDDIGDVKQEYFRIIKINNKNEFEIQE